MSFKYQPIFEKQKDTTEYRFLGKEGIEVRRFGNHDFVTVSPDAISKLTEVAIDDTNHLLRTAHLQKLEDILKDPEASDNDRFVATDLLKNSIIAAERVFPTCQDTGTALVIAKKGEQVITGRDDKEAISYGIFSTYQKKNLRYSQMAPLSMYDEKNTGTNLPAQIDIYSEPGDEYHFLFIVKGGGSANKSYLHQKTKAVLNPDSMEKFVREALANLGTAACPPYHLAIVIGGTSAEDTLKTVKLASTGYLDNLPTEGNAEGRAFRDKKMEEQVVQWARETKIGAQFGGKYLAHDARVIRLPRHGASCPVGIGVSCSADRQIKGKITRDGIFVEQLELHPEQFLPATPYVKDQATAECISIDLNQPIENTLKILDKLPVATRVMLNGPLIVARDSAHAKVNETLEKEGKLPDVFKKFAVYYAGPAKTPQGFASGSFGPTTSERMDPYVPKFQAAGGSLIMLGKGNRTQGVTDSCKQNGGFYLGSIGGPAARLGKECITKVEVFAYPELGMEAIWKIEVKDFPAFVIVDNKGNDFFKTVVRTGK